MSLCHDDAMRSENSGVPIACGQMSDFVMLARFDTEILFARASGEVLDMSRIAPLLNLDFLLSVPGDILIAPSDRRQFQLPRRIHADSEAFLDSCSIRGRHNDVYPRLEVRQRCGYPADRIRVWAGCRYLIFEGTGWTSFKDRDADWYRGQGGG